MAEAEGLDHLCLDRRDVLVGLVGAKRRANDGAGSAATLGLTHELGDGLCDVMRIRGVLALEHRHEGLEQGVGNLADLAIGLRDFDTGGRLNAGEQVSRVPARLHLHDLDAELRDFVSEMTFAWSAVKASVTPADMMPALLTSTSIVPASASTLLTPASTDASSLTSNSTVLMPSFRRASAASRFLPCALRIEAYTVWPERNRVSAVSRPKPLLAPVIRIVLDILGLLERSFGYAIGLYRNEHDDSHSTSSVPLKVGMRRSLSPSASPSCWWS